MAVSLADVHCRRAVRDGGGADPPPRAVISRAFSLSAPALSIQMLSGNLPFPSVSAR
jgi:hypothetical protein